MPTGGENGNEVHYETLKCTNSFARNLRLDVKVFSASHNLLQKIASS